MVLLEQHFKKVYSELVENTQILKETFEYILMLKNMIDKQIEASIIHPGLISHLESVLLADKGPNFYFNKAWLSVVLSKLKYSNFRNF